MTDAELVNGRRIPKVGELFYWGTLGGEQHAGFVRDVDSNVVYVKCLDCADDKERAVEV